MKRVIIILLILAMLLPSWTMHGFAEDESVILPEALGEIEDEAFAGNMAMRSVVIPKSVDRIGERAFSGCTGLTEVYLGNNSEVEIAQNAFDGCGDIHFFAFPETSGELFALSHGFECDLLEEGSTFLQKALQLVAAHGGTASILQSAEFATMRLIVKMNGNKLPDISEFAPTEILRASDGIFFVQFDNVEATSNCYAMLKGISDVMFVEPDACVEVIDDVEAAGTVYGKIWDTEDPMGFDVYSPFVAANSTRRATIAVIDSGVEKKTAYNSLLRADGISLVSGENDWSSDSMRHGSMITGIIKDCVGNANVDILPIKVVSRNGVANLTMIALAIQYALEHGADVINLSLNFEENQYVRYWINKAIQTGVDVVVAAGNSSRNIAKVFPANVSGVITVSGIDSDYELSAGSNYGDNVSYCAPDTDVKCSAYNGTRTGTSFAAPMVAAALALVKMDIYHSVADLKASCRQLTAAVGGQNNYGHGLMQLAKLARIDAGSVQIDESVPDLMAVGESFALEWTVLPSNATDKSATASSSNSNVLKVVTAADGTCSIQAVGKGTAIIEVKLTGTEAGSEISDTKEITVVQPVTSIEITTPKTRLALGKTLQASISSILPTNANDRTFRWQITSKGGSATISDSGLISPQKTGRVSVSALAKDGYGAVSNSIDIDIIDIPDAESVVLTEKDSIDVSSGSIRLAPGDKLKLSAAVLPEEAEQDITWSCSASPSGAITVDSDGVVEAVKAGSGIVKATTENGVYGQLSITVAIMPTALSISSETINGETLVDVGSTLNLYLTFAPSNTTERGVVWTSTNSSVAQVNSNGVITGLSAGTANIIAISSANSMVTSAISITVRQPYSLIYDANGGNCGTISKTAYSGYAVGDLAIATRDYYTFDGWYSSTSGGEKVTTSTKLTATGTYTVYAHWTLKPTSGWVLPSEVPSGAQIVDRKTETTTSTSSSLSGWTRTGESWKQTGSGSVNYASFPGGFDTGHWIYTSFNKSALDGWDDGSTRRDVSNSWSGYVYWHWMYDTSYSNGTSGRAILDYSGTAPISPYYYYKFFGAFLSSTNYTGGDTYYCNNRGIRNYIVPDRTSWDDCQGATRWFRFDYYTSYYTDYQKQYSYSRELVTYREK